VKKYKKYKKFHLNIRKRIFTVRVVRHWSRLPGEITVCPFWRYSKSDGK